MSNVLIGIIGVILFIGLALAGALFLGPRFQEATTNSKASALVQGASQIAHAAAMFTIQEGEPFERTHRLDLTGKGYLKTYPTNPVNPTYGYTFVDSNGLIQDGTKAQIIMVMLDMDAIGTSVCKSATRQITGSDTIPTIASMADVSTPTGCFQPSRGIGALRADRYYIYASI